MPFAWSLFTRSAGLTPRSRAMSRNDSPLALRASTAFRSSKSWAFPAYTRWPALAAYKDFLTLWKDADPDIPILKQAKVEYAKLQ